ncbi:biofilm development regulator YmgB/AriR family protein [Serratia marcescens]|uniref:biofilm development regulator YmgB/AriR family protein n=1 Tax=Serratia marcescens TaxID=615 RepID=UPI0038969842
MSKNLDVKLYGLSGDLDDFEYEVRMILGVCVINILHFGKEVTKPSLISELVRLLEVEIDVYSKKVLRLTLEVICGGFFK